MPPMSSKFYYDGITLDRAHHLRTDEKWLAENLSADPSGDLEGKNLRIIPVWRSKSLISTSGQVKAAILSGQAAEQVRQNAATLVFLGLEGETIYCAADLSHADEPHSLGLPADTAFEDLRGLATSLDPIDAGYLAYARAIIHWHIGHKYCGICGSETFAGRGGHERRCANPDCARIHFPRTDPAVIMLVTHPTEEKCLLGHNSRFRGLTYSTIAGFVEPGEMLEQAVAREVFEETNIEVVDVTYQASQPWPFPASIMLGFRARAVTTEIICHDQELLDARWFSRDDVHEMDKSGDSLPPSNLSISRWLIDNWLFEK
ncbi:MAG: NAD(+) diphosphatase [Rhodospirillaceae bacterium]|nr:NAD(+) diphosphatase [Rhodospirillaceae bacterium]MBT7956123.1 NAD(+) diphosphatase [Rhodospirillaceae bacterium]